MEAAAQRKAIPGSGADCECGEHRAKCRFGRQHSWSTGFVPEALASNLGVDIDLARRGIAYCYECNAVHTPTVAWPAEED